MSDATNIVRPAPADSRQGAALPLILPMVVFLPTLAFYVGVASSLALGTAFAAVLILLLSITAPKLLTAALIDGAGASAVLILLISAHLLVANLFVPIDFPRAIGSMAVLFLVILGGLALALILAEATPRAIDLTIKLCFWLMVLAAIVAATELASIPSPTARNYDKPVFPFTEPSHFALCLTPLLAYCCVSSNRAARILYLLVSLLLIVLLESLTMASAWVLVAAICARGILLPITIAIMAALAVTLIDVTYYLDRLDLSGETGNLSSLVYYQGWELIGESMRDSSNWGIGFQQLGVRGTDVPTSRIIYRLVGDYANILDGGFNLAKLTSEFGLLGVAVATFLVYLGIRSALALRKFARVRENTGPALIFMHAIFVGYLIELLLRGTGYFATSTILLVAALRMRMLCKRGRVAAAALKGGAGTAGRRGLRRLRGTPA